MVILYEYLEAISPEILVPSSSHHTVLNFRKRTHHNKGIGNRPPDCLTKEDMPPSRKISNRAFSLLFFLPYSLVAAIPKPDDLRPILAGRTVDTVSSSYDSQINQDESVTGSPMEALFPAGETTSEGKLDSFLDSKDYNSQAGLISSDPTDISRCGQHPEDLSQVPGGKWRFKRQKTDQCPPHANLVKPGGVEEKVPVKNQTPDQIHEEKIQNPGQNWEPFFQIQKPPSGRTNEGKCRSLEYQVAVCFAPLRSSIFPPMTFLGGLMGMLDPVTLDRMLTLMTPYET